MKALSLFSSGGVAEANFKNIGIDVVLANELDEQRVKFYKDVYPDVEIIFGDIVNINIRKIIVQKAKEYKVDLLIATPPCQGMSIAGKMEKLDPRNQLIFYALDVIKKLKPKYVILENVPMQLKTKIKIGQEIIYIPEYIKRELARYYSFNKESLIKAMDYGVPQMRQRNIFLLTRRDLGLSWEFPPKKETVTLAEALKDVPSLDPYLREGKEFTLAKFPKYLEKKENGLKVSKWHYPPTHSWRMVEWMLHTPSGCSAFENKIYYPKKLNGNRVKGHSNYYRRHDWNKPARTITQNNGVMSSLTCVHPGHIIKDDGSESGRIYSDPRVFSIYELLIVSSLPLNWNIPNWASENLIRSIIGEGIPPLLVEELLLELKKEIAR